VNRVKELVPSVQLYSSNPRNTTLNIRGLGSTFGLTNDGIDPGVGFYVDGVYYASPAATSLDFLDIEQIEVLRGPQGTLFGKNTTAGAFNITTRKPSFVAAVQILKLVMETMDSFRQKVLSPGRSSGKSLQEEYPSRVPSGTVPTTIQPGMNMSMISITSGSGDSFY
jgi:hypothetical protein